METMTSDIIDEQFEVGAGSELTVNTVSGRISVVGRDTSTIRVHAEKHGSSTARGNTRIEISREGKRVAINTKGAQGGILNIGRNMSSVEYSIEVPRDCEVRAKGVSADLDIRGTRRRLTVQTVSGDVALDDVQGDCNVTAVSGDVVSRNVTGTLNLHTTSGDVNITNSQLRGVNLHSVSGDFTIETPLITGERYLINTVSGDLHVFVPPGTGATVQMKSVSGDVVSDLPAEIIKSGRRHWQGRINGGGANVEMHSVSGDLRISRSSSSAQGIREPVTPREPSVSADPPTPPQASEPVEASEAPAAPDSGESAAGAILGELERGEITVEEAMSRLEALR